ncbi:MAG: type II toxin-antitoxin system RelB/DinJ family antitoxin [Kiritimatiellia bacterium]
MAQVSFRIDDTLKSEAETLFNNMGMNLSTAITIFLRQSIDRRALPFEVRACANPLAAPDRILAAMEDYANGKKNYHVHELPPLTEDVPKNRRSPRSRRHAKGLV